MSDRLPPLDADLAALLHAERKTSIVSDARREAMLERFDRTVALLGTAAGVGAIAGATAHAATTATAASAATRPLGLLHELWTAPAAIKAALGVAFVGGAALGSVTTATVIRPSPSAPPPAVSRAAEPAPSVLLPPAPAPPSEPSVAPAPEVAPPASAASAPTSAPSLAARMEQERPWLDRARVALAQGNAGGALQALSEHRRRYGEQAALAEEREVLHVRALLASGRVEDARGRVATFERRYPNSVFLAGLRQALPPP